jgi:hypothetical protein
MKAVKIFAFLLCLTIGIRPAYGKSNEISVPFQIIGSYVVVRVSINGSSTLNLILDSGVRNTIITELSAEDSLTLNYSRKQELSGLGEGKTVMAFASVGNTLQAGKIRLTNQSILALEEDIFSLSKHVGTKINGLLGSDFFEDHIVKIDYDKKRITLYPNEGFIAPEKYVSTPIVMENHKMYIYIPVTDLDWKTKNALLLLDTGAELTAWFRSYGENPIKIPPKNIRGYIGQGLNGEIQGFMGRVHQINVGGHVLRNPVVSFPDSTSITDAIVGTKREGTIGSQILSRFNLIFDQRNKRLYLKPNGNFKKPFTYNIAGIDLIQDFTNFQLPEVIIVRKDSPAEKAGVQVGDRIFVINEESGFKTNINEMKKLFETSSRVPLRLTVLRGNKPVNLKIDMKGGL